MAEDNTIPKGWDMFDPTDMLSLQITFGDWDDVSLGQEYLRVIQDRIGIGPHAAEMLGRLLSDAKEEETLRDIMGN